MTTQQIILVKKSWEKLNDKGNILIGDVFYSKLFFESPELQRLFKTSRVEQANKLVTALAVVVAQLEQRDQLSKAIEQLARRHVNYGVQPEHYAMVGSALLWTLEQLLGEDWDEALKDAWSNCYRFQAQKMIDAAYKTAIG